MLCCALQILLISPPALSFFYFSFAGRRGEIRFFPKRDPLLSMKTFCFFCHYHQKKAFPGKLILFLYEFLGSEQRNHVSERDQSACVHLSLLFFLTLAAGLSKDRQEFHLNPKTYSCLHVQITHTPVPRNPQHHLGQYML